MHSKVVELAESLASVIEGISQDVGSISHSVRKINYNISRLLKEKETVCVLALSHIENSNKEPVPEKEIEDQSGSSHALERLVVAVESLPHEVRNISLSLKDVNENISCILGRKGSTTHSISSWFSGSHKEGEDILTEEVERPPHDPEEAGSSSSSEDLNIQCPQNLENRGTETHDSPDAVDGGDVLTVDKIESSNEKSEGTLKNGKALLSHDDYAASALELKTTSNEKGHPVSKKPKSTTTSMDSSSVLNRSPIAPARRGKVESIEINRSKKSILPRVQGRVSALKGHEDTFIRHDMSSSKTASSLLSGEHSAVGSLNNPVHGNLVQCVSTQGNILNYGYLYPLNNPLYIVPTPPVVSKQQSMDGNEMGQNSACSSMAQHQVRLPEEGVKLMHGQSPPSVEQGSQKRSTPSVANRLYACRTCGLQLSSPYALKLHHSVHAFERPSELFEENSSHDVRSDSSGQQEKMPFICEVCEKKFILKSNLDFHMQVHKSETVQTLNEHGVVGTEVPIPDLKTVPHLQPVGKKAYPCNECDSVFTTLGELRQHMHIHSSSQIPAQCPECYRVFPTTKGLHRHMTILSHGKIQHQCPECEKVFDSREKLNRHSLTHRGQRPFLCHHCGRGFNDKTNLVVHERVHTGEKPYKCPLCDCTFAQSGSRVSHMRTHTGEKPYVCDRCGGAFKTSSALSIHKRTHSGERPCKCNICGKSYVDNERLRRHKLIHSEERPFACSECESYFKRKTHLIAHQRLVHKHLHPATKELDN